MCIWVLNTIIFFFFYLLLKNVLCNLFRFFGGCHPDVPRVLSSTFFNQEKHSSWLKVSTETIINKSQILLWGKRICSPDLNICTTPLSVCELPYKEHQHSITRTQRHFLLLSYFPRGPPQWKDEHIWYGTDFMPDARPDATLLFVKNNLILWPSAITNEYRRELQNSQSCKLHL